MIRIVLCNCSPDEAPALARRLVEEKLAACVNIIDGVRSFYRWEGELCDDQEATLLIKTTEEGYPRLAEKLSEYHSYDVPEIIAVDSAEVGRSYAEWVHEQVR
jgi:periplasmic divalent cation tolerance protein